MHQELANEFDRWAEAGRADQMASGHESVTFQMLEQMTFHQNMVVADIGCGNGWAVREMLKRGAGKGFGADISPKMIELAQEIDGLGAYYAVSSASELPLNAEEIDFLLSIESLYYHPDPFSTLIEWKRVMKSGGKVAVMVDLYRENRATHTWVDALSVPVHLFSMQEYKDLFIRAGFLNVELVQLKNKYEIAAAEDFKTSIYWPSYEAYLSYRSIGSLVIWAEA